MKPLKNAIQKNFTIDPDFYTPDELDMLEDVDGVYRICGDLTVIAARAVKDVKVACFNGCYCTVAVTHSGEMIHVSL